MEESFKTLYMMIGLPRSGKTTRARDLAKKYGCPIVNRDSIRLALHGERFLVKAEPMVDVITHLMVDALFLGGNDRVILDECNVTIARRREWLSDRWNIECVHIDTPESECVDRAIEQGDTTIIPVIHRMAEKFDFDPGAPFGIQLRE